MGAFTNYGQSAVVNHTMGQSAMTMPTSIYLALFTADPTETGSQTNEVANAFAYVRLDITSYFGADSNGVLTNDTLIEMATATGLWGDITHIGLMDSGVHNGGNMIYTSALVAGITIDNTDVFDFKIGKLTITVD